MPMIGGEVEVTSSSSIWYETYNIQNSKIKSLQWIHEYSIGTDLNVEKEWCIELTGCHILLYISWKDYGSVMMQNICGVNKTLVELWTTSLGSVHTSCCWKWSVCQWKKKIIIVSRGKSLIRNIWKSLNKIRYLVRLSKNTLWKIMNLVC